MLQENAKTTKPRTRAKKRAANGELPLSERYKIGKTDFKKQLRWMVGSPPETSVPMTITPSMAEEMLTYNTANRPYSEYTVKGYAARMAAGGWHYTKQPIIFSKSGTLLDGQHRLGACVQSGVSFVADVAFGSPDEAFAFIDVGKKRTAADIFAIHGVKNYAIMASMSRWIKAYEDGRLGPFAKSPGAVNLSPAELHTVYENHPRMQDSVDVAHKFMKNRLAAPSMMAALHYVCATKCRRDADVFFEKIGDGLGFSGKDDPAYKLYQRLIDNAASGAEKLRNQAIATFVLKAWNAARDGRPVSILRYSPEEGFPRAR